MSLITFAGLVQLYSTAKVLASIEEEGGNVGDVNDQSRPPPH